MTSDTIDAFFDDLRQQVDQHIIVDDEDTLARVALLVPRLVDALRRTLPFTSEGLPALSEVEATILSVTQV